MFGALLMEKGLVVVGPPGEEIYCDEWGRVKVSFPWDRESQDNAFSSCWVLAMCSARYWWC